MKKLLVLLVLACALFSVTSCNMLRGAGDDLEDAGDKIEDVFD